MSHPERIASVGIVGAGVMGRGIAQVFAMAGLPVALLDARPGAAGDAVLHLAQALHRQVEKGRMSSAERDASAARLTPATELSQLLTCDLIIEAIVEDLGAKQALFKELDAVGSQRTILASNTSSLPITEIASVCQEPDRVIGLHFFNPVPVMKLVEVVPGLRTANAVTDLAIETVTRIGKHPVRAADMPGFLINHIGRGFVPEALRIFSEGIAAPADIDKVMKAAGFRMGPFELVDLTGLDISQPVMEQIYRQFYDEPMYRPSVIGRRRLAAGLLGRKSGRGFYTYPKNTESDEPAGNEAFSPEVFPIWLDPRDEELLGPVSATLETLLVEIESGPHPSDQATILVADHSTDATTAAFRRGHDATRVVAVDCLFGPAFTVMRTPATKRERSQSAAALLAGSSMPTVLIADSPGFIAPRIVAMLVNVACSIAQQGIAAPWDIDLAAKLGLSFPRGPLEWGDTIGAGRILAILEGLLDFYGDPRYRPSPWLKRRAMLGLSLLTPD